MSHHKKKYGKNSRNKNNSNEEGLQHLQQNGKQILIGQTALQLQVVYGKVLLEKDALGSNSIRIQAKNNKTLRNIEGDLEELEGLCGPFEGVRVSQAVRTGAMKKGVNVLIIFPSVELAFKAITFMAERGFKVQSVIPRRLRSIYGINDNGMTLNIHPSKVPIEIPEDELPVELRRTDAPTPPKKAGGDSGGDKNKRNQGNNRKENSRHDGRKTPAKQAWGPSGGGHQRQEERKEGQPQSQTPGRPQQQRNAWGPKANRRVDNRGYGRGNNRGGYAGNQYQQRQQNQQQQRSQQPNQYNQRQPQQQQRPGTSGPPNKTGGQQQQQPAKGPMNYQQATARGRGRGRDRGRGTQQPDNRGPQQQKSRPPGNKKPMSQDYRKQPSQPSANTAGQSNNPWKTKRNSLLSQPPSQRPSTSGPKQNQPPPGQNQKPIPQNNVANSPNKKNRVQQIEIKEGPKKAPGSPGKGQNAWKLSPARSPNQKPVHPKSDSRADFRSSPRLSPMRSPGKSRKSPLISPVRKSPAMKAMGSPKRSFEKSPQRSPVRSSPRYSPMNKGTGPKPTSSPRFSSLLDDRRAPSGRRNSASQKIAKKKEPTQLTLSPKREPGEKRERPRFFNSRKNTNVSPVSSQDVRSIDQKIVSPGSSQDVRSMEPPIDTAVSPGSSQDVRSVDLNLAPPTQPMTQRQGAPGLNYESSNVWQQKQKLARNEGELNPYLSKPPDQQPQQPPTNISQPPQQPLPPQNLSQPPLPRDSGAQHHPQPHSQQQKPPYHQQQPQMHMPPHQQQPQPHYQPEQQPPQQRHTLIHQRPSQAPSHQNQPAFEQHNYGEGGTMHFNPVETVHRAEIHPRRGPPGFKPSGAPNSNNSGLPNSKSPTESTSFSLSANAAVFVPGGGVPLSAPPPTQPQQPPPSSVPGGRPPQPSSHQHPRDYNSGAPPRRQPAPLPTANSSAGMDKVWNERLLMHEKKGKDNPSWVGGPGGQSDLLQMMYNTSTPKIYPRLFPDKDKLHQDSFNASDPLSIFEANMLHDGNVYKYVSSDEEEAFEKRAIYPPENDDYFRSYDNHRDFPQANAFSPPEEDYPARQKREEEFSRIFEYDFKPVRRGGPSDNDQSSFHNSSMNRRNSNSNNRVPGGPPRRSLTDRNEFPRHQQQHPSSNLFEPPPPTTTTNHHHQLPPRGESLLVKDLLPMSNNAGMPKAPQTIPGSATKKVEIFSTPNPYSFQPPEEEEITEIQKEDLIFNRNRHQKEDNQNKVSTPTNNKNKGMENNDLTTSKIKVEKESDEDTKKKEEEEEKEEKAKKNVDEVSPVEDVDEEELPPVSKTNKIEKKASYAVETSEPSLVCAGMKNITDIEDQIAKKVPEKVLPYVEDHILEIVDRLCKSELLQESEQYHTWTLMMEALNMEVSWKEAESMCTKEISDKAKENVMEARNEIRKNVNLQFCNGYLIVNKKYGKQLSQFLKILHSIAEENPDQDPFKLAKKMKAVTEESKPASKKLVKEKKEEKKKKKEDKYNEEEKKNWVVCKAVTKNKKKMDFVVYECGFCKSHGFKSENHWELTCFYYLTCCCPLCGEETHISPYCPNPPAKLNFFKQIMYIRQLAFYYGPQVLSYNPTIYNICQKNYNDLVVWDPKEKKWCVQPLITSEPVILWREYGGQNINKKRGPAQEMKEKFLKVIKSPAMKAIEASPMMKALSKSPMFEALQKSPLLMSEKTKDKKAGSPVKNSSATSPTRMALKHKPFESNDREVVIPVQKAVYQQSAPDIEILDDIPEITELTPATPELHPIQTAKKKKNNTSSSVLPPSQQPHLQPQYLAQPNVMNDMSIVNYQQPAPLVNPEVFAKKVVVPMLNPYSKAPEPVPFPNMPPEERNKLIRAMQNEEIPPEHLTYPIINVPTGTTLTLLGDDEVALKSEEEKKKKKNKKKRVATTSTTSTKQPPATTATSPTSVLEQTETEV